MLKIIHTKYIAGTAAIFTEVIAGHCLFAPKWFTPENQNSSLSRLSTQVHFSYWSHMMLNILLSVFRKCLFCTKGEGKSTPSTPKEQNNIHHTHQTSRTKHAKDIKEAGTKRTGQQKRAEQSTQRTPNEKKLIYIYKVSNMLILINLNENQLIKCAEAQFQLSYSSTWPYNTHVPCRPSLLQ